MTEMVSEPPRRLVDFPTELLTTICTLVGCPAIVWCRLICRRLRDVIDASLELAYQIELVQDGLIDTPHDDRSRSGCLTNALDLAPAQAPSQGRRITPNSVLPGSPSSTLTPTPGPPLTAIQRRAYTYAHANEHTHQTTSDRLARLREVRRAWGTLKWSRCVTVPMPGPCCAYELVGGVFCKTQPSPRRGRRSGPGGGMLSGYSFGYEQGHGHGAHGAGEGEGEWNGDGPHEIHGARTMSLTWLPGTRDDARTVVRDDLGIATRDFALDPSQDLMVLFKGGEDAGLPMVVLFPGVLELHLRTISSNQTHPNASVPVLRTAVVYPVTSVSVQIVDDVIGMIYGVDPARPRITIWNWKMGRLVVDRTSGNLPSGTWDFSFIHSRAFFVTTADGNGALELFTFTCDPPSVNASAGINAHVHTDNVIQGALTHVATLHLPPIHPSARVLNISTHTGPFLAGCPPGVSFTSSNRDRVHVLTVQYIHLPTLDGPRMRPRVGVVVHQRGLERYLGMGAWMGSGRKGRIEVPWTEWGRTQARVLPYVGLFQWLRYVHGQRFVMLHPTKGGKSTLQVLDFNVHRASGQGEWDVNPSWRDSETTLERVDYTTRIMMPNIFVDVVESGLPYLEARRDVRGDYSGFMIDDERLVGLKYPAFLSGDMKEIVVLTM